LSTALAVLQKSNHDESGDFFHAKVDLHWIPVLDFVRSNYFLFLLVELILKKAYILRKKNFKRLGYIYEVLSYTTTKYIADCTVQHDICAQVTLICTVGFQLSDHLQVQWSLSRDLSIGV
jgi:hypothetical protein